MSYFKRKHYVGFLVLLVLVVLIVPSVKLFLTYLKTADQDYSLEIMSQDQVLVKYVYSDSGTTTGLSNENRATSKNRKVVSSNDIDYQQFDAYINQRNLEFKVSDSGEDEDSLFINQNDDNSGGLFKDGGDEKVILDKDNVNVVSSLKDFEVVHDFDATKDKSDDEVVLDFEKPKEPEAEKYLSSYVDDSLIQSYQRPVTAFLNSTVNQFYTSPPPSSKEVNTLDKLRRIEVILSKDFYYRFEIVRINLVSKDRLNLKDLKIYVTRGKYVIPNVGGRSDSFFKYKANTIYSTATMGYNPPIGVYNVTIKSISNPNWKGIVTPFKLKRRIPPKLENGFAVVNWEYGPSIESLKFRGLDNRMGDYHNILKWADYMEQDALWVLAGQTTGWDGKVTSKTPWGARSTEKSMNLLAAASASQGVQVGAYVMSYFTPANGKKNTGYAPSLGFNSKTKRLEDSLHISLADERRLNDIVSLTKRFEANPNVHYIGLDFIRTGRADGYEMGPQVVDDMNISTPKNYNYLTTIEKIKWFASKVENLRNRNIVRKWRWWRAHKVASIVNAVIRRGKLSKPVWVFTLGWQHGQQHGQDPYMFFDAGVFADAVMLYEANRIQFRNMMVQWPNYMRNSLNNVIIGNAADIRFLDNEQNYYGVEYLYRSKKAYRNIYKDKSMAKGIFLHDLSRANWSSKRGFEISEWAVLHGHVTSSFRQEKGLIPYKAKIEFNEDLTTGKIIVQNTGDEPLEHLTIHYSPTPAWGRISDNIPRSFSLAPHETKGFLFQSKVKESYRGKGALLGYYLDHPNYPKYFFLTFQNKEKQKKVFSYLK